MLWSAVFIGVLGGLIGLRYRAPALIPATIAAFLFGVAAGWVAQRAAGGAALTGLLFAAVLSAGYLAVLALRTLRDRPNPVGRRQPPSKAVSLSGQATDQLAQKKRRPRRTG